MTLYPGQRAAFWRDGPLGDTRSQWLGPQLDDFALALQTMEQADARSAAALFVPPEMTGVEDLDRHGRWQQHPEYGAVWSPSVVAVDWAPYRYGQWVWLRPWGWTWVDDAPWGFAPFHYGRWLWWGKRWCWAPGPKVARPVFAPALVGWVGGPQFSVVVGSRPVPAMGWLPLGPRDPYRPPYSASPGHLKRLNPHVPPGSLPPPAFGNRGVPGAVTVWPADRWRRASRWARPRCAPTRWRCAGCGRPRTSTTTRRGGLGCRRATTPHREPSCRWASLGRLPCRAARDRPGLHRRRRLPIRLRSDRRRPTLPCRLRRRPGAVPRPAAAPHRQPTRARAHAATCPAAATDATDRRGPACCACPACTRSTAQHRQHRHATGSTGARTALHAGAGADTPGAAAPRPATPPARNDADDGRNPRQGADPGERRRTPESRYTPRER